GSCQSSRIGVREPDVGCKNPALKPRPRHHPRGWGFKRCQRSVLRFAWLVASRILGAIRTIRLGGVSYDFRSSLIRLGFPFDLAVDGDVALEDSSGWDDQAAVLIEDGCRHRLAVTPISGRRSGFLCLQRFGCECRRPLTGPWFRRGGWVVLGAV